MPTGSIVTKLCHNGIRRLHPLAWCRDCYGETGRRCGRTSGSARIASDFFATLADSRHRDLGAATPGKGRMVSRYQSRRRLGLRSLRRGTVSSPPLIMRPHQTERQERWTLAVRPQRPRVRSGGAERQLIMSGLTATVSDGLSRLCLVSSPGSVTLSRVLRWPPAGSPGIVCAIDGRYDKPVTHSSCSTPWDMTGATRHLGLRTTAAGCQTTLLEVQVRPGCVQLEPPQHSVMLADG